MQGRVYRVIEVLCAVAYCLISPVTRGRNVASELVLPKGPRDEGEAGEQARAGRGDPGALPGGGSAGEGGDPGRVRGEHGVPPEGGDPVAAARSAAEAPGARRTPTTVLVGGGGGAAGGGRGEWVAVREAAGAVLGGAGAGLGGRACARPERRGPRGPGGDEPGDGRSAAGAIPAAAPPARVGDDQARHAPEAADPGPHVHALGG